MASGKTAEKVSESTQSSPASSAAAQQSDNVAHALAGAGGGLLSMALTDSCSSAVPGYEWTRAGFERAALQAGRASKKLTTIESMIAGALAGSATVLITNPIWVVNTRMTARKNESDLPTASDAAKARTRKKAPSTIGTLMTIIKEEGFMQLFAGVLPALVLVINPILQYTVFEQLKNVLERRKRVTPSDSFYLGAFGKLMATGITYPYITVKSRMHVAPKGSPKEDMFSSFRRILKEEGWSGLYGGKFTRMRFVLILAPFTAANI
ncbi:MAG: hypothetical protein Q9165_000122 [Trypethelium subeluteriae]